MELNVDYIHVMYNIAIESTLHAVTISPQAIHMAFWPWFRKDKAEERDYSTA